MVTFHVDLEQFGTVAWETEDPRLINIFQNAGLRKYFEKNLLPMMLRTLLGTILCKDTEAALDEFEGALRDYATKRIKRIDQLSAN